MLNNLKPQSNERTRGVGINSQQMKGRVVINDSLLKVVTSSFSYIVPFNSEVPYGVP